jgi:phage terminase large subunit-like protein
MALQTLYSHFPGKGKRARRARLRDSASARQGGSSRDEGRGPGMSEEDTERLVKRVVRRAMGETFIDTGRQLLTEEEPREVTSVREDGRIAVRRHFSEEIWAAIRKDYEAGATSSTIVENYGVSVHALKGRARAGKWSKTVTLVAPPVFPPDDPAQLDETGASAWPEIAHAAQLPPEGEWQTWLFQGGRGAGKTRAGAEWLAARALATPHGRFALVAATEHDAREVMIEGPSGLRSLPGRKKPRYEASRRRLKWDNQAVAYVFSAQEPERLRGPQFMAAWADEFCAWPKMEHTLTTLRLGLRLGDKPQLVVTTTPKPLAALRRLRAEPSCVVTEAATSANAANLSKRFVEDLQLLYGGTRVEKQELEGVLLDAEGALWRKGDIAREPLPAKFDRVVVGVDPPAGAGVCGIVVAGRVGHRAFVLEDASCEEMPALGWAERVAAAVKRWGAVKVMAESNQGGDMVRSTLRTGGVTCAIELAHAAAGKAVRAQPAAALYQKGRVAHCGQFELLEEELLAIGSGEGKCDRADALVWALHDLLVRPRPTPKVGLG